MRVRSADLVNGQTRTQATVQVTTRYWPLGFVLLVFGVLWWLPAARTTVDGWVIIINTIGSFFAMPGQLARLTGVPLLVAAILVGLIYSRVETREMPISREPDRIVFAAPMVWVGWLFLAVTDVGSTFLGVITPPAGAWPIHVQIASSQPTAFALALVSTFAPDWIIIAALSLMGVFRRR